MQGDQDMKVFIEFDTKKPLKYQIENAFEYLFRKKMNEMKIEV